jgi:hypothetical protein
MRCARCRRRARSFCHTRAALARPRRPRPATRHVGRLESNQALIGELRRYPPAGSVWVEIRRLDKRGADRRGELSSAREALGNPNCVGAYRDGCGPGHDGPMGMGGPSTVASRALNSRGQSQPVARRGFALDSTLCPRVLEASRAPAALSLYFMFYNLVRVPKTLRTSPAMAAGVAQTLWTMEDIATRIEARAAKPAKRGP